MWQTWIVYLAVGGALAIVVYRVVRLLRGKRKSGGCYSCSGCVQQKSCRKNDSPDA